MLCVEILPFNNSLFMRIIGIAQSITENGRMRNKNNPPPPPLPPGPREATPQEGKREKGKTLGGVGSTRIGDLGTSKFEKKIKIKN